MGEIEGGLRGAGGGLLDMQAVAATGLLTCSVNGMAAGTAIPTQTAQASEAFRVCKEGHLASTSHRAAAVASAMAAASLSSRS